MRLAHSIQSLFSVMGISQTIAIVAGKTQAYA
jgi:hypothetical protein